MLSSRSIRGLLRGIDSMGNLKSLESTRIKSFSVGWSSPLVDAVGKSCFGDIYAVYTIPRG